MIPAREVVADMICCGIAGLSVLFRGEVRGSKASAVGFERTIACICDPPVCIMFMCSQVSIACVRIRLRVPCAPPPPSFPLSKRLQYLPPQ